MSRACVDVCNNCKILAEIKEVKSEQNDLEKSWDKVIDTQLLQK